MLPPSRHKSLRRKECYAREREREREEREREKEGGEREREISPLSVLASPPLSFPPPPSRALAKKNPGGGNVGGAIFSAEFSRFEKTRPRPILRIECLSLGRYMRCDITREREREKDKDRKRDYGTHGVPCLLVFFPLAVTSLPPCTSHSLLSHSFSFYLFLYLSRSLARRLFFSPSRPTYRKTSGSDVNQA